MAAIIAPIVARDEAESMLIKSANRTIQVRPTQTSSDKTQPNQTEVETDPTEPKPDPTKPNWTRPNPNWTRMNPNLIRPIHYELTHTDPNLTQT